MKTYIMLNDKGEAQNILESNDPGIIIPINSIDITDHKNKEEIKHDIKKYKIKDKKLT